MELLRPCKRGKKLGLGEIQMEMVLPYKQCVKGSQNLDGENYYFDPVNCDMQLGWVNRQEASGTKRYYYDPNGETAIRL